MSILSKNFSSSLSLIVGSNKKFLIAISGGVDSEVLLDLCLKNIPLNNLHAIHINHNLTAQASRYEHFVKKNCFKNKIPLTVISENRNNVGGESMEMWGRRIRYKGFYNTLIKLNFDYILTAHHANDNLETVLMNLDRGCYIKGLRGILPKNGKVVRPLIEFKKSDIISYANENKIDFIHDVTNDDITIKRNYVRKKIVPSLIANDRNAVERFLKINRKAQNAISKEKLLTKIAVDSLKKGEDNSFFLEDSKLVGFNSYFKIRLIKEIIGESNLSWSRFRYNELKNFLSKSLSGERFFINKKWVLLRDRINWVLYMNINRKIKINVEEFKTQEFNGEIISFKKTKKRAFSTDVNTELIDLDTVKNKDIQIRNWTSGDKFQPLGMDGSKKVSDYLIDRKIDRLSKEKQLVMTANDEIVWLLGQRISNKFRITNNTSNMLELSMSKQIK